MLYFLLDCWTLQHRSAPSQLGQWLERHIYSLQVIFDGRASLFPWVLLIKLKPKNTIKTKWVITPSEFRGTSQTPFENQLLFFFSSAQFHIKSQFRFESSSPQPSRWRYILLWKGTISIYFIAKAEAFLQLKTPYGEHSTAKFLSIKLNGIQHMCLPWLQCWPKCAKRNVFF